MACAMCLFLTTILISEPVNFVICCFPSTFFKIIHKPVKSANEEWGLVRTLISVIYALRSMFSESIGSFENLNMSLSNLNTCKFAHFYSLVILNCSSAIFVKANNYSFWHKVFTLALFWHFFRWRSASQLNCYCWRHTHGVIKMAWILPER